MMERPLIIVFNKIRQLPVLAVLLLGTISILHFSGYGLTQINLGAGMLFAFFLTNYVYFKRHRKRELNRAAFIGALIITISLTLGSLIRDMDQAGLGRSLHATDLVYAIGTFGVLYLLMHNLLCLLESIKLKEMSQFYLSKSWCIGFVICFLIVWLPYYLTFFPGIFGSDPLESIRMGTEGFAWTNHHPVLYTAYIKLFLLLFQNILGINGALGVMIFSQQCILASVFSYTVYFMWKRGIAPSVLLATFLFMAVNPVIAVFSVYATKDVLFSACILLLILRIYHLQESIQREIQISLRFWIGLSINACLVVFLRNNGSFIMIGLCAYLLVVYRKYWKKTGSILLLILLCVVLQKQVLFPALQVKEGSFAESLSIPLQQIGQAVVDGARMTEEEEAFLEQMIPLERMKEVYQAGYTDTIKFDSLFDDDFLNDNKAQFMKVWFGMLPDNFGSYVKAYLLQTAGYWDISQTESLTIYGVVENNLGIRQIDVIGEITGFSIQPVIEKLILVCRKLPVLCYLTNMAMMLFYLFLVGYLVRRRGFFNGYMIPLWISWLTIMVAAPASCKFRYMLPMYFALPVLLWIMTSLGMYHEDK